MQHIQKLTLKEIRDELIPYFNWSANALVPFHAGAADIYLKNHRNDIQTTAQKLLKLINYVPGIIYRGIIMKESVDLIVPHSNFQYLSFSTDRSVAEHFADVKGFGSKIMNVSTKLGNYGYVIEYTPKIEEIIFHYGFLSILPYAEAFSLLGFNGSLEVQALERQREITVFQPTEPFTNITRMPFHRS